MTSRPADVERIEVQIQIRYEPNPGLSQKQAWAALWRRLLSPGNDNTTPAGKPVVESEP
jgi:hypothetical protein